MTVPATTARAIEVRTHDRRRVEAALPRWEAFVERRGPLPLSYHPAWLLVLAEGLGHAPYCLEAVEDGPRDRGRRERGRGDEEAGENELGARAHGGGSCGRVTPVYRLRRVGVGGIGLQLVPELLDRLDRLHEHRQLLAQAPDVDVHGPRPAGVLIPPHVREEEVA